MLHIIRLLLLVAAVTACTPVVYGPNAHIIPELYNTHDMSISGRFGGGYELEFTDLSAGYAVSPHLALMANASYARGGNFKTGFTRGEAIFLEPAFGLYYADLPAFNFYLFGAYGAGRQFHYLKNGGMIPLNWRRYSLLPSAQYRKGIVSLGLSARIGYLQFDDGLSALQYAFNDGSSIYENRSFDLLNIGETGITFSLHLKNFKWSLQWAELWPKHLDDSFEAYYFGAGLSYHFSTKGKSIVKPVH